MLCSEQRGLRREGRLDVTVILHTGHLTEHHSTHIILVQSSSEERISVGMHAHKM